MSPTAIADTSVSTTERITTKCRGTIFDNLPEDWRLARLKDYSVLLSGHHVLAEHCNCRGEGFPYLTGPADFPNGIIEHSKFTAKPGTMCKKGDILVTVKGSGSGYLIISDSSYCISRQLMAIRVRELISSFVFYFLLQNGAQIQAASTGLIPGLSRSDLLNQPIAIPPIQEQMSVASALSDVDRLISTLDNLSAKKRAIKLATMQQLFAGSTRLPGFEIKENSFKTTELGRIPGDWKVCKIREIGSVRTGPFGSSLHERDYVDDGTPIITVEHLSEFGILHEELPMVSKFDRDRLKAYSLQEGDIVFSRVGSVDRNALVRSSETGWLFSGRLLRIRPTPTVAESAFLSYYFHQEPFKVRVRNIAVGQTMASLNTHLLGNVNVILPGLTEQRAISSVLSDMDAEISALERRSDKAKVIKQGMMQALLTGRIRLVKPGAQE
jgi:type I restriction enzyme, S subunit